MTRHHLPRTPAAGLSFSQNQSTPLANRFPPLQKALTALALAQFLHDTYQRKYPGADVLWKVMQATRTGKGKIDKFTPANVYLGGKTGTYSGPNASPETVDLPTIEARGVAIHVLSDVAGRKLTELNPETDITGLDHFGPGNLF